MTHRMNYVLAGLGLLLAFILALASPAMANPQDYRGTFAPGTKCLDGSAPRHLGQVKHADGKLYDRWGCNDAAPRVAGRIVTGDIVRISPPPHVVSSPDLAQYQHDLAAQAAEIARLKAKPVVVSYNGGGFSHAKSAMDLDTLKTMMSASDTLWANNFRVSRDKFVKDVAKAVGKPEPRTIDDFVKDFLGKATETTCSSLYLKTVRRLNTAGNTRLFGKCPGEDGDQTVLVLDGVPFWLVEDGTLLTSTNVIR